MRTYPELSKPSEQRNVRLDSFTLRLPATRLLPLRLLRLSLGQDLIHRNDTVEERRLGRRRASSFFRVLLARLRCLSRLR